MKNIFLILIVLLTSILVHAEEEGILNRLFAPGPLILGHEDLEGKECLKCHESGKGVVDAKCLDCHKDIRKFVEAKSGFHGQTTETCVKCHADHKGRDLETTKIDFKTFDHTKTGYKLEGKHFELKCEECHNSKRGAKRTRPAEIKFVGANSSCRSCHKKEDIHFYKGEFAKKDCNVCHGLAKWNQDIKFDHEKDTKFVLNGFHEGLECQECHNTDSKKPENSQYKWSKLKTEKCLSCHENYHKSNLSSKFQDGNCAKCHNENAWKIPTFEHKITGYTLRGKHEELTCGECHENAKKWDQARTTSFAQKTAAPRINVKWVGLKKDCLECHDDEHRYGNYKSPTKLKSNNCLNCHNESAWDKIHDFEHSANTRFKIDGEHRELECSECHLRTFDKDIPPSKPGIYIWQNLKSKTCEVCHKSPHTKTFSKKMLLQKCTDCHVTDGWAVVSAGKNFDHNKTRFQLTEKHIKLTCTECHVKNKKQVFKWESKDKGFCVECHQNVHLNQFHEKYSSQSCGECHDAQSFAKRKTFDHGKTAFALKLSHTKLECKECHSATQEVFPVKPPKYKGLYKFANLEKEKCSTCHTDVHKKQLGSDCTKCHNEDKWKKTKFDHSKDSKFVLKGEHETTKCEECHKPTGEVVTENKKPVKVVRYKTINTECLTCHSDVHMKQLGTDCLKCHTENDWKKMTFDHFKQTRYPLLGKHEKHKCGDCHKQTKEVVIENKKEVRVVLYRPISPQCSTCHKDAHHGHFGGQCNSCHNEKAWKTTTDYHKNFSLNGVHLNTLCVECHLQNRKLAGLSQECIYCHKKDDIHSGTLPTCRECHTQMYWENTKFRHSMTGFPLKGAHRTLYCQDCHYNSSIGSYGSYQGLSSDCYSCHKSTVAGATTPVNHTPVGNFTNCLQCHHGNPFRW